MFSSKAAKFSVFLMRKRSVDVVNRAFGQSIGWGLALKNKWNLRSFILHLCHPADRSDDEEGLEEGERKASPGSLALPRPVQADRRRGSQEGADSAEGRWGERGEGSPTAAGERRPRRGGSRTPSRSPTPRRDSRDSSFERDKEGGRLDDRPEELIKEIEDDMDVQQEDEDADERERARDPRSDHYRNFLLLASCKKRH